MERHTEIQGLIDIEPFEQVDERSLNSQCHIFGSRFMDEVKKGDGGIRLKSRLISKHYNEEASATIDTKEPTAQKFTQR